MFIILFPDESALTGRKEERGKPWSPANHALKFTAIGRWPGIELAEPGYPAAHQLRKDGFLLGKAGVARIAKTP
jgi:hypothetical protein